MALSLLARKYLATLTLTDEEKREFLKTARARAGTDELSRIDLKRSYQTFKKRRRK